MTDYIKREGAAKALADMLAFEAEIDYCDTFTSDDFIDDAKGYFEDIPSADVAPVVRCEDCKYWNKHSQYGYDSENGVYGNYCMIWTPEDDFYAVETPEDGFCYKGERKDDE